jgi:hypothetical protein
VIDNIIDQEPGPDTEPQNLPLERVGQEICRLAGQIAAATSRFLRLLADFDARSGWAGWNVKSCAHWLSWRCGLDLRTAREHVRVARALTELPRIREAFDAGRISYSKVRAIARVATATSEADLLDAALHAPAAHIERLTRGLRTAQRNSMNPDDLGLKPQSERPKKQRIRWQWDYETGDLILTGRLAPEDGARLLAAATRSALELARHNNPPDPSTETTENGSAEPSSLPPIGAPARKQSGVPETGEQVSAPDQAPEHAHADQVQQGDQGATAMTTRPPADLGPALIAMAEMACTQLDSPIHAPAADVMVTVDIQTLAEAFADDPSEADSARNAQPHPLTESASMPEATTVPETGSTTDAMSDARSGVGAEREADARENESDHEAGTTRGLQRQARLNDGPALTTATLRRLADDGRLRFALNAADGRILDIGRARRTPNTAQLAALWRRDQGCAVPGCGRIRSLHAHHVVFWTNGGTTDLNNLILLCGEHHRALHGGAFTVTALGRQRFRFNSPAGALYSLAPPIRGTAIELIDAHPQIEPETIQPDWDGTPVHNVAISAFLTLWNEVVRRGKAEEKWAG